MSRRKFKKRYFTLISAVFIFFVLLPVCAKAELALGVAKDIMHAKNTYAATLRYDWRPVGVGAHAWLWSGSKGGNGVLAVDYNLGVGPVDINAGGAYLTDTNEINGTHLNFSLGAALNLGEHFRVQFTHFSNGKYIFKWEKTKHNAGWNFLGVAYRF